MRGKLLFITGLAVGAVLGARAGRPAYDALRARLDDVASSPCVHDAVAGAKAALEEKAPAAAGALERAAETASATVTAVQETPEADDGDGGRKDEDGQRTFLDGSNAPEAGGSSQPATGSSGPAGGTPEPALPGARTVGSRRVRSSGGAPAKADG